MRALLVLTVLAGCGRFGFGDVPSIDAPVLDPDAPPPCPGPDEDGDGWPNACDNCPTVPNVDQLDVGEMQAGLVADAVGDACDPAPTTPGDFIALVEYFDVPGTGLTYTGDYSFPSAGVVRLGSVTTAGGSATYSLTSTITRVMTEFEIVSASPTIPQWIGVWTDRGAGREAVFPHGNCNPGVTSIEFTIKEQDAAGDTYSPDLDGAAVFAPGQHYWWQLDKGAAGQEDRLVVREATMGALGETLKLIGVPRTSSGFMEARAVVGDFHYLVIYAR